MLADLRHSLTRLPEGKSSPAIQQFLKDTAGSVPLTDRPSLQAKGKAAADGRPAEYQAARAALRQELTRVRESGKGPYKASDLLEAEAVLHQYAGVIDSEFCQLRAVWQALYSAQKAAGAEGKERRCAAEAALRTAGQIWAAGCLKGTSSPASRYRARLVSLLDTPLEEVTCWLNEGVVKPEWTALIRYALLFHQGQVDEIGSYDTGRLRLPLEAMALAHQRKISSAHAAFLQLASSAPQGYRWLEVGGATLMSQCGFGEWVATRSRLSVASLRDNNWNVWSAYRNWKGVLSAGPVREISRASLVRRVFTPEFLPLFLYRLSLTDNIDEAFSLLSPVLLQQSLGPLARPLERLDSLPEEGLMWAGYSTG